LRGIGITPGGIGIAQLIEKVLMQDLQALLHPAAEGDRLLSLFHVWVWAFGVNDRVGG
jgi:hypothetical protein